MKTHIVNRAILPLTLLVWGLFALAADSMAAVVERSNPNNEYTASGTDIYTVQVAANAAAGDVITVSGNATFLQPVKNSYTVRTFTIRSADENQQTITVGSGRCYDLNTASQNYNFTFENLFFQGDNTPAYAHGKFTILSSTDCTLTLNLNNVTFKQFKATKNPNNTSQLGYGGVIHIANDTNSLVLQGSSADMIENSSCRGGALSIAAKGMTSTVDNLTFKNNTATDSHGGAIYSTGPLTFTADNLTFKDNSTSVNHGGAIYTTGALSITANSLTFENNSTSDGQGGAIYASNAVTISANTLLLKGNTSTKHAGGIRVSTNDALKISGNSMTFDGNKGTGNDGGALCANIIEITGTGQNPVATFKNNEAKSVGGAITGYTKLTLKTGSFYFDKNILTNRYTGGRTGGAIETAALSITDANVVSFTNNKSLYKGGAINLGSDGKGTGTIEAKTILFQDNSASDYGGAINGGSLTFSGSGTTATFTGNTAGKGGNDLYLNGESGTVLSFTNTGTYSFDGGIYLAAADVQTVIDQAQVTIAGRANVSTNTYQLRNVSISNGGKLTVNLDQIDSLAGVFSVGTADSVGTLDLNVGADTQSLTLSNSLQISSASKGSVVKTGAGTLKINAPEGTLNVDSLTVSEGQFDLLGGSTSVGLTVASGTVFSPGNSVGTAEVGQFTLGQSATLLLEQDASGMDLLKAASFDVGSGVIDLEMGAAKPGEKYSIIKNTTGPFGTGYEAAFWTSLLDPSDANYWILSVDGDTVFATINSNAIPEPATWLLLLFGAFGLLYVRKRK